MMLKLPKTPVVAVLLTLLVCVSISDRCFGQAGSRQYLLKWIDELNTDWRPTWSTEEYRLAWPMINQDGVIVAQGGPVGSAIVYLPEFNEVHDLKDLGGAWIDLETGGTVQGWQVDSVNGINSAGQIVGRAIHSTDGDRIYLFDSVYSATPQYQLLPGQLTGTPKINDGGTIAAGTESTGIHIFVPNTPPTVGYAAPVIVSGPRTIRSISNSGLIACGPDYLIAPDADGNYIAKSYPDLDLYFSSVNDGGLFAGYREISPTRKRDNPQYEAMQFDYFHTEPLSLIPTVEPRTLDHAINNDGDIVFRWQRAYLYSASTEQTVPLDELVMNPDSVWITANLIMQTKINDQGWIVGTARYTTDRQRLKSFLLIPVETISHDSPDTPLLIPDNHPDGVISVIKVFENESVEIFNNATVMLNITHPRPADLRVWLSGPDGQEVQLTNLTGRNEVPPQFNGSSKGDWKIQVIDNRNRQTGTLNSWSVLIAHHEY